MVRTCSRFSTPVACLWSPFFPSRKGSVPLHPESSRELYFVFLFVRTPFFRFSCTSSLPNPIRLIPLCRPRFLPPIRFFGWNSIPHRLCLVSCPGFFFFLLIASLLLYTPAKDQLSLPFFCFAFRFDHDIFFFFSVPLRTIKQLRGSFSLTALFYVCYRALRVLNNWGSLLFCSRVQPQFSFQLPLTTLATLA